MERKYDDNNPNSRQHYIFVTCSSAQIHNCFPSAGSPVAGTAAPTRAHGMRYWNGDPLISSLKMYAENKGIPCR